MAWHADARSFDLAEVDALRADQAFLVSLAEGTRRARLTVKDESGNWRQFAMAHLAGDEGIIKMRAPDNVSLEDCRVEVSMTDPFPYKFYQGETEHSQKESAKFHGAGDNKFFGGPVADAGIPEAEDAGGGMDTVQESDLWQWRGDSLYFFNQRRGLQVFDLSDPASPRQQASLRMPAVGDQMYILNDQHVLLLANFIDYNSGHWWGDALPYYNSQRTEAIVVRHQGEELKVISRVAMDGNFVESRLVGERLYLATRINVPEQDEEGGIFWRRGLQVNGIDFSTPDAPIKKAPLDLVDNKGWFWNSVVTASPEYLLVSTARYDSETRLTKSRVFVIPIGRDLPTLAVQHEVELKANLNDKFKLRMKGGILTTVTQKNVWREELTTYVESFDLLGDKARKLDELLLAPQERLHATRFDGDRLYVVTFFVELRKDPLFVIDLSDPSNLKSLGELEIPGWSTYLVPEGGRLLSVGLEDGNVAISLFDVSDTSTLKLIKRVYPGEGRSWSEANWDEKAVGYLSEHDLLLLPIQTYNKTEEGGHRHENLMQIVDVLDDDVVLRGSIEHEVQGRRATALGNHIASISGTELIVVDATNRDAPVLESKLTLAWTTDRVVEHGDHLLQIENAYTWQNNNLTRPTIRITTQKRLDVAVGKLKLPAGGIVGTIKRDNLLYVARLLERNERVQREVEQPTEVDREGEEEPKPEVIWEWVYEGEFAVDVVDLNNPTEPTLVGTTKQVFSNRQGSSGLNAVLGHLAGDTLIWYPEIEGFSGGYYRGGPFVDDIAIDVVGGDALWGGGYYGGYPSYDKIQIVAVDVAKTSEPKIVSSLDVDPKDYAEFGPVLMLGTQCFVSYKESLLSESTYTHRYKMRVLDFADPAAPVLGEIVSVPGMVEGVHQPNSNAVVLFSSVPKVRFDEELWFSTSNSLLQASVYDGNQAFLVSEITIEDGRYTRTLVLGDRIVKPGFDENEAGLRTWRWNQSDEGGELGEYGFVSLGASPSELRAHNGLIFAQSNRQISVLDQDLVVFAASTLSGPVHTLGLRQIEVNHARNQAWIAVGQYGVEPISWTVAADPMPLPIAAQSEEPWALMQHRRVWLVAATDGSDYVGSLKTMSAWRFKSLADARDYQTWAMGYFDPAGDLEVLPETNGDQDGDGRSNLEEFAWGTHPMTVDGKPALMSYDPDGKWLNLPIPGAIDALKVSVTVERSFNLIDWEPLPGAAPDMDSLRVPIRPADAVETYYRMHYALPRID